MKAYPLIAMSIEEAKEMQFKLVDITQQEFAGDELLMAGDYGVVPGINQPLFTRKVEKVLARFFNAEAAVLVRGAGTGAIRSFFNANLLPGNRVLIHDAPIYPTTAVTFNSMGLELKRLDFNQLVKDEFPEIDFKAILVQHARQKLEDSYELNQVIKILKERYPRARLITDDNYAVMKSSKIGVQLGADLSAFSLFKLLGPEGVGCLIGKEVCIKKVRQMNYSGGSQIQGPEAMDALKSLVYAPVMLAIQAEVVERVNDSLNSDEITEIKRSFIANAQSRVILVEFRRPVAREFLKRVVEHGGVPYPVGSESRYEMGAMFYRISGTFRQAYPETEEYMIRINPMRAGANTILRIIKETLNSL